MRSWPGPRMRTGRSYAAAAVGSRVEAGFKLVPTFGAPHYSVVLPHTLIRSPISSWMFSARSGPIRITRGGSSRDRARRQRHCHAPRRREPDRRHRLVWAFLSGAAEPQRVQLGALIVAGDPVEPFLARVVDVLDGPNGESIVHLAVVGVPDQAIDELRHARLLPQ